MKEQGHVEYRISIREPHWEDWTMLWETFEDSKDAEVMIKELAPTYPEGTLLFITGIWPYPSSKVGQMFTRKAFIVNEYGEASSMPRRWISKRMVPKQWVSSKTIIKEPERPEAVLPPWSDVDLGGIPPTSTEASNIRDLVEELDPGQTRDYKTYLGDLDKYFKKVERLKGLSEKGQIMVQDLPKGWYEELA